jgi:DnaJ family protein C protein 8
VRSPPTRPASAPSSSAKSAIPDDPQEMEKFLSREKMAFFQELEMERVLSAFKLNPYDILECPMEADDKTITKIYRRKSLLIHPDKVKDRKCLNAGIDNCHLMNFCRLQPAPRLPFPFSSKLQYIC